MACAGLLGGCRNGGDGDTAQVRLINAVPDPGDLSVAVDGHSVWKHSPYRNNTGYQKIHKGRYNVQVAAGGPAASKPIAFEKGKDYTVVALGEARDMPPGFRVFADDRDDARVPDDKARLRFINAVPGQERMDVLFNNIVGLQRVAYGHRSDPLLLDTGTYDIKVNAAGDVDSLIGPITLRLAPGRAYTLVAMGHQPRPHPGSLPGLDRRPPRPQYGEPEEGQFLSAPHDWGGGASLMPALDVVAGPAVGAGQVLLHQQFPVAAEVVLDPLAQVLVRVADGVGGDLARQLQRPARPWSTAAKPILKTLSASLNFSSQVIVMSYLRPSTQW